MSPKLERIVITIAMLLILIASYFIYHFISFKKSQITKAKQLLSEYKVAQALQILAKTKSKLNKKDSRVELLTFYALIKAKKFDEAAKQLEEIDKVSKDSADYIQEVIEILSVNEKTKLITEIISKSQRLKFNQDYFIELSSQRNSLDDEMQILESGLNYLRVKAEHLKKKRKKKRKNAHQISSKKLEHYILQRCIENANIYIGSKQYSKALRYLSKAKDLRVIGDGSLKDDYYLDLALTYKNLGDIAKAWDNMQLSAQLGNERAKSLINRLNKRYIPKT